MALPYYEAFKTLFPTIFLINTVGADVCIESLPTVQKVPDCPRNFTELQLAVKRKRCDALANIQTCVDPKKFVYHCLVNQQIDGFVEVCAPEWILAGFCGYYDTVLDKIVTNVKKDCTKSAYPCPGVFNSSDTYKYQVCYEVKKKEQGIQLFDEKGQAYTSTSTNHVSWILPSIIIAVGLFIAFIFACFKIRKMNSETGKTNNSNMISSNLLQARDGQSKKEKDIAELKNVCGIDVDEDDDSTVSISFENISWTIYGNAPSSTPGQSNFNSTFQGSNAATEEDTSGMEKSVSKRKNTPLTEEEFNKRVAYRQKVEKERERRRFKENAPSSTPGQSNFNSTFQEITNTSTPNKKELKSTLPDETGDGRLSTLQETMSTDTDDNIYITAATDVEMSEIEEEDAFISENNSSNEEQKSGKKKKKKETKQKKYKKKQKKIGGSNYEFKPIKWPIPM